MTVELTDLEAEKIHALLRLQVLECESKLRTIERSPDSFDSQYEMQQRIDFYTELGNKFYRRKI